MPVEIVGKFTESTSFLFSHLHGISKVTQKIIVDQFLHLLPVCIIANELPEWLRESSLILLQHVLTGSFLKNSPDAKNQCATQPTVFN